MFSVLISALDFAIPILIVIFRGLFGTGVLIELGLMQRLSRFASPCSGSQTFRTPEHHTCIHRGILTYRIPIVLPALGPVVGGSYVNYPLLNSCPTIQFNPQ
ncbi:MAG: hypothetical protein Q8J68_12020 [Methanolobus sp.]|uniref:hypothetical protein n=1 Tax=Methanolobus sp. TaxID=1874737 RepID=UPI00273137C3|nr:hypothetical protein [Methanolobus sp.]MDP2217999.1 hypothetical protein [Methanolobus sp.]